MEEVKKNVATTYREIVAREIKFIGACIFTANKGDHAGQKFGKIDYVTFLSYADGSKSYRTDNVLVDEALVKDVMTKNLSFGQNIKLGFAPVEYPGQKAKIVSVDIA